MTPSRRVAFVLIAIAGGCGVIGEVVGVLAILLEAPIDPASIAIAVVLAFAGAIVGVAQIVRNVSGSDRWITLQAVLAIGALAGLAVALAILATLIPEAGGASAPPLAFMVLGALSAGGSIGLGVSGRRSIQDAAGADDTSSRELMSRALTRVLPFAFASLGGSLVGIFLIVSS
jgi:hypothetical protein